MMNDEIQKFQVSFDQLAQVIRSSGMMVDDLSPLAQESVMKQIDPYGRPAESSQGPVDSTNQQKISSLVQAVARPQRKLVCRVGGGRMPAAEQTVCYDATSKGNAVGITFAADSVSLVEYGQSPTLFERFIARYASKPEAAAPNLIPPFASIEETIAILHAIDLYRRSFYGSLLAYSPQSEPGFTLEAYSAEMVKAAQNKDVRWLMPCFVNFVPNLPAERIKFSPDSLKILVDSGLCKMVRHKESQQPGMVFTAEGKALGLAFERSWLASLGFELSTKSSTGIRVISKGFLAPTIAANHLISLEDNGTELKVNHQAFNRDQLLAWLGNLA